MRGIHGRPYVPPGCPAWVFPNPEKTRTEGMYVDAENVTGYYLAHDLQVNGVVETLASFHEFSELTAAELDQQLAEEEAFFQEHPGLVVGDDDEVRHMVRRALAAETVFADDRQSSLAQTLLAIDESPALQEVLFEKMRASIADCPGVQFDTDGTPHCGALSGPRYLEMLTEMIGLQSPELE